jgi:hypothetical protein
MGILDTLFYKFNVPMQFLAWIASVNPLLDGLSVVNFLDRIGGAAAIVNGLGPSLFEAGQAWTSCHEWLLPVGPQVRKERL